MDSLIGAAICVLCAAQPAVSPDVLRWEPIIVQASAEFGVPRAWIEQVMQHESGGRTTLHGAPITSSAGAIGLMQVMPGTYNDMRLQYHLADDPYDPHDNIFAGAAYLRAMYERYGYPNLFAAYNAGPRQFEGFLLHHRPLPQATIVYANRIVPGGFLGGNSSGIKRNLTRLTVENPTRSTLFFVTDGYSAATKPAVVMHPTDNTLFVPLSSGAQ